MSLGRSRCSRRCTYSRIDRTAILLAVNHRGALWTYRHWGWFRRSWSLSACASPALGCGWSRRIRRESQTQTQGWIDALNIETHRFAFPSQGPFPPPQLSHIHLQADYCFVLHLVFINFEYFTCFHLNFHFISKFPPLHLFIVFMIPPPQHFHFKFNVN